MLAVILKCIFQTSLLLDHCRFNVGPPSTTLDHSQLLSIVVNFENLIYMKLYSLLILTENTKKSKNNFKAPKKSEIVVFLGRILPCKQSKSAIFSTLHHIFPRIRR